MIKVYGVHGSPFVRKGLVALDFKQVAYASYEVDPSRWPAVAGLIARVKEQPQVKAVLEQEAKALGLG